MSGGVDSSVAAAILKNRGFDVSGVFLDLGQINFKESLKSAEKTAEKIGIPLTSVNIRKEFKKEIIGYFLEEFKKGNTPNPCVKCNKRIKFGLLLKLAEKMKFDYLATGHYIRPKSFFLQDGHQGKFFRKEDFRLLQAKDKTKDQSYFLYNLTQKQLGKLLFPLGNYTKEEVKKMADEWKLPYLKKESQDICFLKGGHNEYLKKYLALKKGKIITADNKIIGEHEGLPLYTIGQRHGFSRGGGVPYYVTGKNIKKNLLIAASKADEEKYFKKEVKIKNVNWISGKAPDIKKIYKARIRYRQPLQNCRISSYQPAASTCHVEFIKSQRAVTPGQSLVIYRGNELLGGGIIV